MATAQHVSAVLVEFVDRLAFERCDYDGRGFISVYDLGAALDAAGVPEDIEADDPDDLKGLVSCLPSWYEVEDMDEEAAYIAYPDRVEEVEDTTYESDIAAAYRAATGF